MKRILVPTDFSDQSLFAISSAATLVRKFEAEMVILHVIEKPEDQDQKEEDMAKIYAIPELKLIDHHFKQVMGKPIDTILAEEADIIVMGSKGDKGLHSFFIGSNAEKVAKHASCPVIILKAATDLSQISHIVYPTGMKRDDEDVLPEIKNLQSIYGATLHLIKSYDDSLVKQQDVEKRLREYAEFHAISNYTVSGRCGMDESDVIMRYADEINADMIAMATHDRRGVGKLFGGNISGDVINHNHRPIWVKALQADI